MTLSNKFATQEQAQAATDHDFNCMKESHRLTMSKAAFEDYYAVTTAWSIPRKTIAGFWVTDICPFSDAVYETIEYSADLFPVVESI